jgi:hypothetical protein
MVDLSKVTKVKVGDRIDFYLFGKLEEGVVYLIEEWDEEKGIQIGIEHGGSYPGEWGVGEFRPYRYLARVFIELPKKGNDRPPWYIIASSSQIRKKNERQNLQ